MIFQQVDSKTIKFQSNQISNLTLVEHPHGGLILAFKSQSIESEEEDNSKYAIYLSYNNSKKHGWNTPLKVHEFSKSENPGLFSYTMYLDLRGHLVILFIDDQKLWKKESTDYGKSWSTPKLLEAFAAGWILQNKPIFIEDGSLLIPVHNTFNGRSFVLIFNEEYKSIYPSTYIELPEDLDDLEGESDGDRKNDEEDDIFKFKTSFPVLFYQSEKMITTIMQTENLGHPYTSNSIDGGETWTEAKRLDLASKNNPIDGIRLRNSDGDFLPDLFLFHIKNTDNDTKTICIEHTNDDGIHWESIKTIELNNLPLPIYLQILQTGDQRINLIYSIENKIEFHALKFSMK